MCEEQSETPPPSPIRTPMSTHLGVGGVPQEMGPFGLDSSDWEKERNPILGELSQSGKGQSCSEHTSWEKRTQSHFMYTHTCMHTHAHKHWGDGGTESGGKGQSENTPAGRKGHNHTSCIHTHACTHMHINTGEMGELSQEGRDNQRIHQLGEIDTIMLHTHTLMSLTPPLCPSPHRF